MNDLNAVKKWDLSGLKITQLRFDYQFHVHMWSSNRDLLIIFGTSFELHLPDGKYQMFDPENSSKLGELLFLLHQPVKSFTASAAGHCFLELEDGTVLKGMPHEKYEAWESRGSGELADASLLCGVGGGSPWG